jgi:peptidoglycan/LPS O-acetylase OafA/YrhL
MIESAPGAAGTAHVARTLESEFRPRANALNALRLAFAVAVIWWHSFALTGHTLAADPLRQALSNWPVDSFFAISGFLIVGSWRRTPSVRGFLTARVLRIFPAFWVCLVVTGLVFAPVLALSTGHDAISTSNLTYVARNFLLRINQYGITGTLEHIPYPDVWNGSLWTLWWEFICYLGVLGLGLMRVINTRWGVASAFALSVLGLAATAYGPVTEYYLTHGSRFGVMFLAGALIQRFAGRIPLTWPLVGAALILASSATFLSDYRILGALPLAYAVIGIGALASSPRLQIRNDISYGTYIYAFPVQQILATAGFWHLGVAVFALTATVCTLPIAALSWFTIEKRALNLKRQRRSGDHQRLTVDKAGTSAR